MKSAKKVVPMPKASEAKIPKQGSKAPNKTPMMARTR